MKLVPAITDLTEPYWEGAKQHQLLIQRCQKCGHTWHPPLPRCPECHSASLEWLPVSGKGHVYTFTVVHHATHAAMADKVPYVAALIQLDEGPRVLTNIRNCAADDVRIGMPVKVRFEELTDEVTLPQFEPA